MDEFEAEKAAWQNYQSIPSPRAECDRQLLVVVTNEEQSAQRLNLKIAALVAERDRLIAQIRAESDQQIGLITAERDRLFLMSLDEKSRINEELYRKRDKARTDWSVANAKMEAVRLIDIMKFRAFLRLQHVHMESANRMIAWVDRHVRPFVTAFIMNENKRSKFCYKVADADILLIEVELPSSVNPFGNLIAGIDWTVANPRTVCAEPVRPAAPFRIRDAPWTTEPAVTGRFAFGRFALASGLTAVGRDMRCLTSAGCNESGFETRETALLMAHCFRRKGRKRRKSGLLDFWLPCIPSVVCRLILEYVDRSRVSHRKPGPPRSSN
jgi:hypothetical protein